MRVAHTQTPARASTTRFNCPRINARPSRGRQVCRAVNISDDAPSTSGATNVLLCGMVAASLTFGAFQPEAVMAADANLVQKAVAEYNALEEKGITDKSTKQLDDLRQRYRLRRSPDGRLQLRSSRGDWFQCRLDMEVAGSMLLRDPKGMVYAIQTEALQQIDLSDDIVAIMMFADGDWEKQMSPVEYLDEGGKVAQLKLEEREFREVIGILKEVEESAQ
mmetsp:Transcript_35349/g.89498  ORF Transcript_35349/g.89498 Transcript_35349/m.89498 type:complete len:220 (-) Transcript_35349:646-1305(-)|eukprot:CAMPEP_0202866752 /NCGR_PEP_ID=MMETSP1391-20130828/8342_1 /ASSEMBLY_ACC=CAM_ASM_000867 /TAXON_ID=1034604 /ORGANISM="Chlamydomonas leiostraca, Strain SAG 11-49" /LENGTH=219 /DNA_ID=CAMNT_0049546733 /DNA_START=62 /DNA_END=721 /DNA_ORIENTATION=-